MPTGGGCPAGTTPRHAQTPFTTEPFARGAAEDSRAGNSRELSPGTPRCQEPARPARGRPFGMGPMGPRHMREVCGQPATAGEARVRGDASAFVKHLDGGLGEACLDARVHELIPDCTCRSPQGHQLRILIRCTPPPRASCKRHRSRSASQDPIHREPLGPCAQAPAPTDLTQGAPESAIGRARLGSADHRTACAASQRQRCKTLERNAAPAVSAI